MRREPALLALLMVATAPALALASPVPPVPTLEVATGPEPDPPPPAALAPRPPHQGGVENGFVLLGLRAQVARSAGGDTGQGGEAGMNALALLTAPHEQLMARLRMGLWAGYGAPRGFLGEARLAMAVGPRLSAERKSAAIPVGFELLALRGPTFSHSLIEIPQVALAYHLAKPELGVETGVRAGYAAFGRFSPGDETRKLGQGVAPGVYFTAAWYHGLVELDYRVIQPTHGAPSGRVHLGRLAVCLRDGVAGCLTGQVLSGPVGDRSSSTTVALGLSLGAGAGPTDPYASP